MSIGTLLRCAGLSLLAGALLSTCLCAQEHLALARRSWRNASIAITTSCIR